MHDSSSSLYSRRSTLKFMSALPFLPMTALANEGGRIPLAGQGQRASEGLEPSLVKELRFEGMAAPSLDKPEAMATTSVGSALVVTFKDGSEQTFPLAYQPFFTTGDWVPDGSGGTILAGGCYDITGRPILDRSDGELRPFYSDCPDGMSLLTLPYPKVPGIAGATVFAVVQFEYVTRDRAEVSRYGQLPSPIAVLTLDQDPRTGRLRLVKYFNVDTSGVEGLWITCGASLSPWNTHLSSEEYEPDATTAASNPQFLAFSANLYGDPQRANPYHYGHLPEVTVLPDGSATIQKHYCLGRISHELVQVMPDERTVLMGDDATNGGAFLFIADRPRDLSSGTLYVAKWLQKSAAHGGSADLRWIKLGHARSDEVKAMADSLTAADIMDVKTTDPADASYTRIAFGGKSNWIKIRPGREKAAAYLETHRYAAYCGGSLGFTKFEGTTVDARDKVAYVAISYIQTTMVDGSSDIKVEGPRAGAVYALHLRGGQLDESGNPIASEWVPIDMASVPELVGEDLGSPDILGNLALADKIANPDNLKFSSSLRTLFIGEDSGMHVNNFLWAFNVDTRRLSRLLSCPAGAESTGLHAADDVNGYTYILSNFQHPGDWELTRDNGGAVTGGLHAKVYAQLDPLVRAHYRNRFGASVGYLAGVPPIAPHQRP